MSRDYYARDLKRTGLASARNESRIGAKSINWVSVGEPIVCENYRNKRVFKKY